MYKKQVIICREISELLMRVGKENEAYNRIATLSDDLAQEIDTLIQNKYSSLIASGVQSVLESIQMVSNALDHDDVSLLYDVLQYDLPIRLDELGTVLNYEK